jgi:hypothetical protein
MGEDKQTPSIKSLIGDLSKIEPINLEVPKVNYSYLDKLKDPRWQRKRLEIFERDNFTCRLCNDNLSQLQLHHLIYFKKEIPIWDYNNNLLITLCDSCHAVEQKKKDINIFSMFLINHICDLTNLTILELMKYFEEIDYLIGNEDYSKNEAFKKLLLNLIKPS